MAVEQKGTTASNVPAEKREGRVSMALFKQEIIDNVTKAIGGYVDHGEIDLPKDYSATNALKLAWLKLQTTENAAHKPVLEECTKGSVIAALLDMTIQGLNVSKNQGYFIAYGNQLSFQRSYFGSMALAKRVDPRIEDFTHLPIYEGDDVEYTLDNGRITALTHKQKFGSIDKTKIIGAYAMALDKEGKPLRIELMTFAEIEQAWKQSKMNPFDGNGNLKAGSTHEKFTADMAVRTVVNKLCKWIVNTSSDKELIRQKMKQNDEFADRIVVEAEIAAEANTGTVIDLEATKQAALPEMAGADAAGADVSEQEKEQPRVEAGGRGPSF